MKNNGYRWKTQAMSVLKKYNFYNSRVMDKITKTSQTTEHCVSNLCRLNSTRTRWSVILLFFSLTQTLNRSGNVYRLSRFLRSDVSFFIASQLFIEFKSVFNLLSRPSCTHRSKSHASPTDQQINRTRWLTCQAFYTHWRLAPLCTKYIHWLCEMQFQSDWTLKLYYMTWSLYLTLSF